MSESDIKSAVAFFNISFSISRRCIFFFISRSSSCSEVRGSPVGGFTLSFQPEFINPAGNS
ncbi:hypothetical protein CQT90_21620 [Salmonella enterica]|uniref:Uncharacterized protein n=1 Tax=Salmonella enterica subsp. enterica serovar Miami TaxID=286780 RepID=A0A753AF92_SALET|nr:hypothetical protein [Salmonella enterica]ECD0159148.1 hypothetical protein [Salmonella enterica subsp. enterica]ECD4441653.1 hypothetical protein [Salmonella enterica subsp. enterica serovar Florida]ECH9653880.1 hypothetical protein [Salmonella enterica subsp. enterica serovar Miami]ECS7319240.1 hypothetical protein [Salmonella enterica subsp. enterica serovar Miami str. CFSAN000579]ECX3455643.1 hypothetical protein [Salmonella enterica subsp. enterica serovar Rubislaw]EDN5017577.1 hypoth